MSSSREQIFSNIRRGLKRGPLTGNALESAQSRLQQHPRNTVPRRSQLAHNEQVELFVDMATEAAAELIRLENRSQLPEAVAGLLARDGVKQLIRASSPQLTELDWSPLKDIATEERVAHAGDIASLTGSFAGIAETGTLMLLSGEHSPTTLNFLPDIHLVVLDAADIVGPYEDAWQKLRSSRDDMPRTVNMITGPSRSADIEQKLQMGAHGPKRLVIFLIGS